MRKLDFSNVQLIDKYYREKFTFDVSKYFEVNGWRNPDHKKDFEVTTDTFIFNLYTRGSKCCIDGLPATYMGCGPWYNTNQNFEFGGIFAYLYIATKCIRKHCGNDEAFQFRKTFTFPSINDQQAIEDFDVVATLREASLIPYKAEAENYLLMMQHVIPYMKEVTADFIDKLDPAVKEEIDYRLEELRQWVEHTQDEALSFHGLAVRKEYLPEGSRYSTKYYLLDSLSKFSQRYDVYNFKDIVELSKKRASFTHGDITEFDGPIVPHYEDLDYIIMEEIKQPSFDIDDPFPTITEQEENENKLYNNIINLLWDDETYEKEGQKGLKDCWGRVIIPAEYEDCEGVHDSRFLIRTVCVHVKKDGKWALIRRDVKHERITDYVFDDAKLLFNELCITRIGNKHGLYTPKGHELLPTIMEDIYNPTVYEQNIMYKQDGKYGILFHDGTRTTQLLDEVRVGCGYYLSVRIGNEWGYIDEDGNFTRKREFAFVESNGFNFSSMVIDKHGVNREIDLDKCVTLEDMTDNLKRKNILRRYAKAISSETPGRSIP